MWSLLQVLRYYWMARLLSGWRTLRTRLLYRLDCLGSLGIWWSWRSHLGAILRTMEKVTLPEKLSMLDNNTLAVPVLPWGIERKLGSVETLKSGPVTRISMKRLCTMFPLVAVTSSSKKVDGGVPRGAVTVSRAVAN